MCFQKLSIFGACRSLDRREQKLFTASEPSIQPKSGNNSWKSRQTDKATQGSGPSTVEWLTGLPYLRNNCLRNIGVLKIVAVLHSVSLLWQKGDIICPGFVKTWRNLCSVIHCWPAIALECSISCTTWMPEQFPGLPVLCADWF